MSGSGLKWQHYKVNRYSQQDILSIENIFRVLISGSSPQLVQSSYPPSLKNPWNMGLGAYLDLALIFLLLRFSLLILFFLHLALIALAHFSCRSESSNKSLVAQSPDFAHMKHVQDRENDRPVSETSSDA